MLRINISLKMKNNSPFFKKKKRKIDFYCVKAQADVGERTSLNIFCDALKSIQSFIFCGVSECFRWLVSMQPALQWSTRSYDRTRWDQPRKRIGWEGKGKFLRVLRGGRGIQDSVTDNRRGWGGLISRLCVHFFLVFGSRGWPISFPRSFSPVHGWR